MTRRKRKFWQLRTTTNVMSRGKLCDSLRSLSLISAAPKLLRGCNESSVAVALRTTGLPRGCAVASGGRTFLAFSKRFRSTDTFVSAFGWSCLARPIWFCGQVFGELAHGRKDNRDVSLEGRQCASFLPYKSTAFFLAVKKLIELNRALPILKTSPIFRDSYVQLSLVLFLLPFIPQ